jgi:hypothetical protein
MRRTGGHAAATLARGASTDGTHLHHALLLLANMDTLKHLAVLASPHLANHLIVILVPACAHNFSGQATTVSKAHALSTAPPMNVQTLVVPVFPWVADVYVSVTLGAGTRGHDPNGLRVERAAPCPTPGGRWWRSSWPTLVPRGRLCPWVSATRPPPALALPQMLSAVKKEDDLAVAASQKYSRTYLLSMTKNRECRISLNHTSFDAARRGMPVVPFVCASRHFSAEISG